MNLSRYHRQTLVKTFGEEGQRCLHKAHAVIIGCGGLGSHSASTLVRMGIGTIDLIDHDTVDLTNLHRTAVFTEDDVGKPKSEVLAAHLRTVNHDVAIYDHNITVTSENITTLLDEATIVLDGTDSLILRTLINQTAVDLNIPWVYAGVYETCGMVLGIIPRKTPCFHCLAHTLPKPKTAVFPVHGYLPQITASFQVVEAIRILQGKPSSGLLIYDSEQQRCDTLDVKRNPRCVCCGRSKP
jgi:molybdopterin/thiamine biosynthesis adenylyltransferase